MRPLRPGLPGRPGFSSQYYKLCIYIYTSTNQLLYSFENCYYINRNKSSTAFHPMDNTKDYLKLNVINFGRNAWLSGQNAVSTEYGFKFKNILFFGTSIYSIYLN